MRRSLQALTSLAVLALTCAGTATAGATHRSAAIVCPGSGPPPCCGPVLSQPGSIPCCVGVSGGPSFTPCCGPTIINCPGLTISSSRDPSTARQAVKITGRLRFAPASGTTITLWQELPGQVGFHRAAQTKTDSTGVYTFTRRAGRVQTNRSWYVTATGLKSLPLAQMVEAVVSLSASAQQTGGAEHVTFTGRVIPSHAGQRVRIQERTASGWTEIASGRVTRASTFSIRTSFPGSAGALVRAALRADSRNVASYSAAVHTTL